MGKNSSELLLGGNVAKPTVITFLNSIQLWYTHKIKFLIKWIGKTETYSKSFLFNNLGEKLTVIPGNKMIKNTYK